MPRTDTHYRHFDTTQHDPRAKVAVNEASYAHNSQAISYIYDDVLGVNVGFSDVHQALDSLVATTSALGELAFLNSPLGIIDGGTGQITKTLAFDALSPTTTVGDLIYRGALNNVRLGGNITTTRKLLSQVGDGAAAGAPEWSALVSGDLPSHVHAASDITSGTISAARMPAFTGEVTTAAGSTVATIANDAVIFARMQNIIGFGDGSTSIKAIGRLTTGSGDPQEVIIQAINAVEFVIDSGSQLAQLDVKADGVTNTRLANMAVNTIKGRITSGTGDPEDLTAAQVRTIINVADGANNYVHPNHSGDVVSVGDGATTIQPNVVTFAKFQNIATDTLIGRDTAATGVPESITVGGGIEFTGGLAIRTTAFTGEVTKAAGGTVLTIANDAVIFARMQNLLGFGDASQNIKVIGRLTTGSGDPQEVTISALGAAVFGVDSGGGQVTVSIGVDNTTIQVTSNQLRVKDAGITLVKLANIATDTLIGRDTAASGVPESIAVGGGIEFTGALAIRTTAFTGDVTKAAGGTVLTIPNDTVTFPKMRNAGANSILVGSGDAGVGIDYTEITLGAGLTMTGTVLSSTATGSGDVVGPGSATDNAIARFDSTTGKLIQNSVVLVGDTGIITGASIDAAQLTGTVAAARIAEVLALADLSDVTAKSGTGTVVIMQESPTITTPTITTPVIASNQFANATHTHLNAAGGGTLTDSAIVMDAADRVLGSTSGGPTAISVAWTSAARSFLALGDGSDRQVLRWLTGNPSWATLEIADLPIPFLDTQAIIAGSADQTKLIRFEADGITTETTRVITMADQDVSLVPGTGTFAPGTSALATGILKSTTATGALSIAVGADLPAHVHAAADITSGILALARGGTGSDLSATGGAGNVLRQSGAGAVVTVSQLAASDLSNGTTGTGPVVLQSSPNIVLPNFASGFVLDSQQLIGWLDAGTGFTLSIGVLQSISISSKNVYFQNVSGHVALIDGAPTQAWTGPQYYSNQITFATGSAPKFEDHITMNGAFNIKTTSAGTKFGAQLGCKIALYTNAPVGQQAATTEVREALKVLGVVANGSGAANLDLEGGNLLNIASVDTNGATDLVFKRNTATQFTLQDGKLLLDNPTTTTFIGWPTSGQINFGVGSEIVAMLTSTTLTFEEVAADSGVGIGWGTNGQLDFRIGGNPVVWVTDVGSAEGRLDIKIGASSASLRSNASAALDFYGYDNVRVASIQGGASTGSFIVARVAIFEAFGASSSAGSVYFDNVHYALTVSENGGDAREHILSRSKAVQTASVTVSDTTTAETTLLSLTGSGTLSGGSSAGTRSLEIGRTIRVTACGTITTSATPEPFNLRVKYGSTVLCSTGDITPTLSLTNRLWWLDVIITVRTVGASGTCFAQGKLLIYTGVSATMPYELVNTATVTIDTTVDSALDVTVDYTNTIAGTNTTVVCTNALLEVLM